MPRSRAVPRESDEQAVVVQWCRAMGIPTFSVPNGARVLGPHRYAHLSRLKREGMLAGVPDLIIVPLNPHTGQPVAVEMKRRSGGRLSERQGATIAMMRAHGWYVIIAQGAQDAIEQLSSLGYAPRRRNDARHTARDALGATAPGAT